jgi:hypothetical protein
MGKNYPSPGALVPIRKLLDEAGKALNDPSRTLLNSGLPNLLGAGAGVATGGAAGAVILTAGAHAGTAGAAAISSGLAAAGGIVGGGMFVGISVVAAPAVVLGIGGYALISTMNRRKLDRQRRALLQEALAKTASVAEQQRQTAQANHDRADYLTALNARLRDIVRNLQEDLGEQAQAA